VSVEALFVTVDLQLSPSVVTGPFDRCVVFDLWDCDAPGGPLRATVEQTVSFRVGSAADVGVPLPGGQWDCITARDKLHTLRSTAVDFTSANGVDFTASFVGSRATGGHWLVGGNLNGDNFIDIVDFAIFFPRYLSLASPNAACGTTGPHANLNGDGVVDLLDLVFISGNSLAASEANCCGLGSVAGEPGPVLSITVEELAAMGYEDSAAADLNGDGVVDTEDLREFLGGDLPPVWEEPSPRPLLPKRARPQRAPGLQR
jgi:hypothetical protein